MSDDTTDDVGYAPMATVQRYHEEDKRWKEGHRGEHHNLRDVMHEAAVRLGVLETKLDSVLDQLKEARGPRVPVWQKVGAVVAALGLVGGVAVYLARAPGGEAFDVLRQEVVRIQLEQVRQGAEIDVLKRSKP